MNRRLGSADCDGEQEKCRKSKEHAPVIINYYYSRRFLFTTVN